MTGKNTASTIAAFLLLLASGASALAADRPSELRRQIDRAEDEYFALYNRLNTERRYEIVCRKDQATGTRLARRVCQPRYLLQSAERSASDRMQAAISAADTASAANAHGPNVGASAAVAGPASTAEEQEGFRQNMLAVLRGSPELQALGRKRDELQQRYDETVRTSGARP